MIYYNKYMQEKKQNRASSIEFGKRLRQIRKAKGFTQYQLADLVNTSQRMIAHYETQKTRPPLDKLITFAEALNVSFEELAGRKEPSKKLQKQEETSYKIMKRVKVIEKLPIRDQKAIFRLINSLAEKNKLKGKIKE